MWLVNKLKKKFVNLLMVSNLKIVLIKSVDILINIYAFLCAIALMLKSILDLIIKNYQFIIGFNSCSIKPKYCI